MPLSPGARLGPYEILSPLGEGGMGEVYRARDPRLGREIAIKVLPAELSSERERLARFEQEARSASALNHPNIVTIYEIGQADSSPYIAMELVEGRTLRELLAAGPLPLRKTLGIAAQVAGGLSRAHEAGIVHRDLKPENLMVSKDELVKILDFGLAKLVAPASGALSGMPTVARDDTRPGTVLGTVGYMSPEQASGQPLDFRSDQFSLGSILYEMATGKRAFSRGTAAETLSAIIREEPEPVSSVNPQVPAPFRWIVERCHAKDPEERYASTRDLARDLANVREHISEVSGGEAAVPAAARRRSRERLAWSVAALLLVAGLAAVFVALRWKSTAPLTQPLTRLTLTLPPEEFVTETATPVLALSPDGTKLVYSGYRRGEKRRLYLRPMDRFEATPIPGTEGGTGPFFSPDGEWVGFWADRKLKKVSLAGGSPLTLCDAPAFRGASWGEGGTILFAPLPQGGLSRISAEGGKPKAFTSPDPKKNEMTHRWPQILPGGKAALFTINSLTGDYDQARIGVVSLDTGERRTVLEGGTDARYVPTGHLVYSRGGSILAVPFDLKRLDVTGPPAPITDDVRIVGPAGFALFSHSNDGSLVYLGKNPKALERGLVWVDRKGTARPFTEARRDYSEPRLSPDGQRLAIVVGDRASWDIWMYELARGVWSRLTLGGLNWGPVWARDGNRLAFASNRNGPVNVFFDVRGPQRFRGADYEPGLLAVSGLLVPRRASAALHGSEPGYRNGPHGAPTLR